MLPLPVIYVATRLLSRYCAAYPGMQVSLDATNRRQLVGALAENTTDIELMRQPPPDIEAAGPAQAAERGGTMR